MCSPTLNVYCDVISDHTLKQLSCNKPHFQGISAGLYLYHNLPILQIHKKFSYQIGRTDTNTDIHSWLYQLVYTCASCASRGARRKFEMATLKALSRRCRAVLRGSVYPVHGSASEVNCSSADAQVVSCHRYLVVSHPFVEQLTVFHTSGLVLLSSSTFWVLDQPHHKLHVWKRYGNYA